MVFEHSALRAKSWARRLFMGFFVIMLLIPHDDLTRKYVEPLKSLFCLTIFNAVKMILIGLKNAYVA